MTIDSLDVLVLLNFTAIGLLPIVFFRRDGQYNLRWLATALPFFVVPVTILAATAGLIEPATTGGPVAGTVIDGISVTLAAMSIATMAMTVASHRVPISLWHQDDDAPVEIVTWGPYASVRHPFYTSFILAFLAAALAFVHVLTAAALAWGIIALSVAARREERRLCGSALGADYRCYMAATGRFIPGLG
jgi:protein-S-isoprenylcysteine O-methyltransferase Ste14